MTENSGGGYAKPPRHSQWRKGQSGNPGGKKKGAPNLKTSVQKMLLQKVRVTRSGKLVSVTRLEYLLGVIANPDPKTASTEGDRPRSSARIHANALKTLEFAYRVVGPGEPDLTEAALSATDQAQLDMLTTYFGDTSRAAAGKVTRDVAAPIASPHAFDPASGD